MNLDGNVKLVFLILVDQIRKKETKYSHFIIQLNKNQNIVVSH